VPDRLYHDLAALQPVWPKLRPHGRVVFTNGCFDVLHAGHVDYLQEAASLGDFLVLGLNDDDSVRRLKGLQRPINDFADRALVLAGLRAVDLVVGFAEDTPFNLIQALEPDLLVKGGDWQPDQIVGADLVQARGGLVRSLRFREGRSTTGMVDRILARYRAG